MVHGSALSQLSQPVHGSALVPDHDLPSTDMLIHTARPLRATYNIKKSGTIVTYEGQPEPRSMLCSSAAMSRDMPGNPGQNLPSEGDRELQPVT